MGTVYQVRLVGAPTDLKARIEADLAGRLKELDSLLSVYRPESETSRFNALTDTDQALVVSGDFFSVMSTSFEVHGLTGGAFDPTVKPLTDIWGFGPAAKGPGQWRPPDRKAVEQALAWVGLEKVDVPGPGRLRKTDPRVQLDFGGVAKGYALDQIAEILRGYGLENFLVEIGGDILASGSNRAGEPWRIGVMRPVPDVAPDDVLMVLQVRNKAVVTSGDYRQAMRHQGRRISHVLDPLAGRPLENNVASVTVVAETAAFADALATGLMVLGAEKGMDLLRGLPDVEAMFLVRDKVGGLATSMSAGFPSFIAKGSGQAAGWTEDHRHREAGNK